MRRCRRHRARLQVGLVQEPVLPAGPNELEGDRLRSVAKLRGRDGWYALVAGRHADRAANRHPRGPRGDAVRRPGRRLLSVIAVQRGRPASGDAAAEDEQDNRSQTGADGRDRQRLRRGGGPKAVRVAAEKTGNRTRGRGRHLPLPHERAKSSEEPAARQADVRSSQDSGAGLQRDQLAESAAATDCEPWSLRSFLAGTRRETPTRW